MAALFLLCTPIGSEPGESDWIQGLPEAILIWLPFCLRNFLTGRNVSVSEETVKQHVGTETYVVQIHTCRQKYSLT